jgi:hypothetical protein
MNFISNKKSNDFITSLPKETCEPKEYSFSINNHGQGMLVILQLLSDIG